MYRNNKILKIFLNLGSSPIEFPHRLQANARVPARNHRHLYQ